MQKKQIEVAGVNTYELQDQFDTVESKQMKQLKSEIAEQYQGDGEFQASETSDEILEGESATEISGAYGKAGTENGKRR